MSHAQTVIELADGLTVLIGENNSGKSAIVAALQAVCHNASGSFMVRHQETDCQVTVQTDENYEVSWRRIKGKVSYVVNGREVDRLKGNIPGDLHQILRLPAVATSRDEFDIHFGEQKKPIFLLGDRPSDRAAFFASSSDTCKLIEMQELHRSRLKEAKQDKKRRLRLRGKLQARSQALQPLDQIEAKINHLQTRQTHIESARTTIDSIRKSLQRMKHTSQHARHWHQRRSILQSLQPLPELADTQLLRDRIHQIESHRRDRRFSQRKLDALSRIHEPPALQPTTRLAALMTQLADLEHLVTRQTGRLQILDRLRPTVAPDLADRGRHLRACLEQLVQADRQVDRLKKQLVKQTIAVEEIEAQLRHQLEQLDVCPTCGQKIDLETALSHSRLHDRQHQSRIQFPADPGQLDLSELSEEGNQP